MKARLREVVVREIARFDFEAGQTPLISGISAQYPLEIPLVPRGPQALDQRPLIRGMSRCWAAGTGKQKPSKVGRDEHDRRLLAGTPRLLGVCFFEDAMRVALLES